MKCDICGYENDSLFPAHVVICKDGVKRCTPCQNLARLGKKWLGDDEGFPENAVNHEADTDIEATWPLRLDP